MTLYYYSTSDDFAKSRKEDEEFKLEKSSAEYESLTKHLDGILYKFNEFLKSFPMTEQEIFLEKSDKFYNNKYHFTKTTAKSLWYDRAVTRLSMDANIPKEIIYVVKCVMEKGGDYADYLSPKVVRKAASYFRISKKDSSGDEDAKQYLDFSNTPKTAPMAKAGKDAPSNAVENSKQLLDFTGKGASAEKSYGGENYDTVEVKQPEGKPSMYRNVPKAAIKKDYASLTPAQNKIVAEQAKTPTPANWTMPGAKVSGAKTGESKPKQSGFSKQRQYISTKYDKQHKVGV